MFFVIDELAHAKRSLSFSLSLSLARRSYFDRHVELFFFFVVTMLQCKNYGSEMADYNPKTFNGVGGYKGSKNDTALCTRASSEKLHPLT